MITIFKIKLKNIIPAIFSTSLTWIISFRILLVVADYPTVDPETRPPLPHHPPANPTAVEVFHFLVF